MTAEAAAQMIFAPRRMPAEPWEEPAGAAAVPHTLPSGAVVSTWGDEGPAVLLVHGWEGRSTQFAGLIGVLVASGRRAVAVDAPGHGRSPDAEYSPVRHGEVLLEALPGHAPFEAVVTHSFGSTATFHALRHGLTVGRIALISPLVSLTDRLAEIAGYFGFEGPVRADFLDRVQHRLSGVPIADLDIDRRPCPDGPTLLCHDTEDREIPVDSTIALARQWTDARLIVTNGLRHRRILADPTVVETVARHLGVSAPVR
ncbi:alpha/beta fold hydrolase [Cryptosporangium aurantiacum]|nr:alpha/beta hydrolase [Cryptosporangium aurantiacum]